MRTKYYIFLFIMFGLILVFISQNSSAEQTKFKQQILPKDCIFEVIDIGTQKLKFLTPDTCPVDPLPVEPQPTNPIIANPGNYYNPVFKDSSPISITPVTINEKPKPTESFGKIQDLILKINDDVYIALIIGALVGLSALLIKNKRNKR